MPRPTLEEVYSIPDPMLNDSFDLVFTNIPGGGDGRLVRIQCLSTALPGSTIMNAEIELFGHKIIFGARKTFSHSMTVALNETYDGRIRAAMEGWLRRIKSKDTQTGGFASEYAITGVLTVYDQTGAPAMAYEIHRMFPNELPEYAFEGSGGQPIRNDMTFTYGYIDRIL